MLINLNFKQIKYSAPWLYNLISGARGYHTGPRRSKLSPEFISSCHLTTKDR